MSEEGRQPEDEAEANAKLVIIASAERSFSKLELIKTIQGWGRRHYQDWQLDNNNVLFCWEESLEITAEMSEF